MLEEFWLLLFWLFEVIMKLVYVMFFEKHKFLRDSFLYIFFWKKLFQWIWIYRFALQQQQNY